MRIKQYLYIALTCLIVCGAASYGLAGDFQLQDGSTGYLLDSIIPPGVTRDTELAAEVATLEAKDTAQDATIAEKQAAATAATDAEVTAVQAALQDADLDTLAVDVTAKTLTANLKGGGTVVVDLTNLMAAMQAIDASGFDGNLTTTDDTLQELAQAIDDLVLGSGTFDATADQTISGDWEFTAGLVASNLSLDMGALTDIQYNSTAWLNDALAVGGTDDDKHLWSIEKNAAYFAPLSSFANQTAFEGAFFVLPSGESVSVTEQAADPTSDSADGFYGAVTSQDFFYKSSTGLWNITAGTYTADPASSSLYTDATAVWDFENNATDTLGTHDLTNNNAVTFGTTTPPQGTYYATFASASSQYFSIADHADFDLGGGDYTIAFWANFASVSGGNILAKTDATNGYFMRNIFTDSNRVRVQNDNSGSSSSADADANVTSTWVHYVVVYNSSADTFTIYQSTGSTFDSSPVTASSATNGPGDNNEALTIGKYATMYLDGSLDEMVIWKGKALTSTEAESVFDGTWRD